MAIIRRLNVMFNSGNAVPYWIKHVLKLAGWTVFWSGNGQGGSHAGIDLFSNVAAGNDTVPDDNVLGYSGCWFVIEAPNGRQLAFWRSSSFGNAHDDEWGVYYSPGGLYTGGDEDTCATATDELILFGSRPPGAPIFQVGGSTNLIHVVADDAPVNGEYKFCAVELIPTNATSAVLFWDTLRETAPGDGHPFIAGVINGSLTYGSMSNESGDRKLKLIADVGGGSEAPVDGYYGYYRIGGQTHIQRALISAYDGKERPMPSAAYGGSPGGWLGMSEYFEQAAVNRGYPSRDDTELHLYLNDFIIKNFWDGASTPMVL